MDRDHFYKHDLPRLREYWAALAAAENQEGGKAITHAEEKEEVQLYMKNFVKTKA